MFQCPNCGSNIRFDVKSQQLACDYCGTKADPYSFEKKTSDAIEQTDFEDYEVTVFTCPQCGGEILSTDNAAAGFCSFCGASTVLYSRISREHRPNYIIPFKKTKEDCKQAYADLMSRAVFAPKELKDPQKIDSFRGIYMPYWAFYETQRGPLAVKAEKSHRRGDYIITDHYDLSGEVDSYYKGISYDASSSFADNISETIAPYDVKGMKAFTPAFLSGFYADIPDVPAEVYRNEAEMVAYEQSLAKLKSEPAFKGYSISTSSLSNPAALNTRTEGIDQAMFPVWFMSYRSGDRVAYATVNGQTGKVAADIPVDIKKFVLASLVLAVPIFLVLNLFFTVIPTTALTVTGVFAIVAMIISCVMAGNIVKRENGEDDRGFMFLKNPGKLLEHDRKKQAVKIKKKGKKSVTGIASMIYILFIFVSVSATVGGEGMTGGAVWILILVVGLVVSIIGLKSVTAIPGKKGLPGFVATMIGVLIGAGLAILKPVSDLYYYAAMIYLIAGILILETELMEQYNLTATRRLPQFDKQGGDDRA